MTGLAARLRPAGATGSFDRRLIAPMVLGAILNPVNMATYGRNLLTFVVSYAFLYGYTQWLEDGRGLSPSAAGLGCCRCSPWRSSRPC